jgi:EAL domain-containing protein (putative c-di-GMP-specific phosphodiesterase class I)
VLTSFHAEQELDRIGARLAATGAAALLLVDVEPLARIERRHGGEVHQRALDELMRLVRELGRVEASSEDLIVTHEQRGASILAFLFKPIGDHSFYSERLRRFATHVRSELSRHGRRAVYPYYRDPLNLGVGISVILRNPGVKPVRQILRAVEEARADAQLELGLQARRDRWRLLEILLAGAIHVRFEPIVDLRNNEVLGYEALARGPRGRGAHTPQELFRLAEEAGLLFELDCLCRRIALEQSTSLPRGKKLFLNCLPTAIGDPNLRDEGLRKTLETFHLRPSDLVLEISENESIENFATFREMRDACQGVGIEIAIDDAGTGYASLEAIMEISPDFIKTDMGLVRGIDSDPPRQEIVRALNSVAQGIGALVIAEGIETAEELRVLRELGVPYGQGYHFGPALHGEDEAA